MHPMLGGYNLCDIMRTIEIKESNIDVPNEYMAESYPIEGLYLNNNGSNRSIFMVNKSKNMVFFLCNESDFVFGESTETKSNDGMVSESVLLKAIAVLHNRTEFNISDL